MSCSARRTSGTNVYEVLNDGTSNAAAYTTLSNFKQRAFNGYWGGASPAIPDYFVNGCFKDSCKGYEGQTVSSRWAMVLRANQIRQVGVTYTYLAQHTRAEAAWKNIFGTHRATRGVYRCDTYVLDVYAGNAVMTEADGSELSLAAMHANVPLMRWISFRDKDLMGNNSRIAPLTIFNRLKMFAG